MTLCDHPRGDSLAADMVAQLGALVDARARDQIQTMITPRARPSRASLHIPSSPDANAMSNEPVTQPLDEEIDAHDPSHYENTIQRGAFVGAHGDDWLATFAEGAQRAILSSTEYTASTAPEPGTEIDLLIEQPHGEGEWQASAGKADKLALFDLLVELARDKGLVDGTIVGERKGGLSVDIGVRAFLPWSQVDLHRVHDPAPYIGRAATFQVLEFDEERCQPVVSRRKVLETQRDELRAQTLDRLEPGVELEGVVRGIKPYGAFVDVGGIEGLLHVSNMSWGRVDHPSELVRVGDTIRVVVLDYKPKKKRLGLGRKQLLADPWEGVAQQRYSEGDRISGKVVSLADFGAFIEIEPGLEGLVHVTELAWTGRISHPSHVLELGQEVGVQILSIDPDQKRIGLSIKALEPNPWATLAESIEPHERMSGPIRSVTDFGLFVEVDPGIEGLAHASNLSWSETGSKPSDYAVGQEIEVVVLGIDVEAQRLDLGVKQLSQDPWAEAVTIAVPGRKIEVEITRLADFGAFARVIEGVEGLIHISELSEDRVEEARHVVRPGQRVEALVLSFDRDSQRISLSLKRDALDEQTERTYADEVDDTASTLGDLLRAQLGLSDEADETPAIDESE